MPYIPERGDIVWLDFNPQSGHEQAGRRPALVLSPQKYNAKTRLVIVCPITTKAKSGLFDILIGPGLPVSGAVLSDQVKSLSWEKRNADFICRADPKTLEDTLERIATLLGIT